MEEVEAKFTLLCVLFLAPIECFASPLALLCFALGSFSLVER